MPNKVDARLAGPVRPKAPSLAKLTPKQLEQKIAEFLFNSINTIRQNKRIIEYLPFEDGSGKGPYIDEDCFVKELWKIINESARSGDPAARKLLEMKGEYFLAKYEKPVTGKKGLTEAYSEPHQSLYTLSDFFKYGIWREDICLLSEAELENIAGDWAKKIRKVFVIRNIDSYAKKSGAAAARKKLTAAKKGGAFRPAAGKPSLEIDTGGENGAAAMKETKSPIKVKLSVADKMMSDASEAIKKLRRSENRKIENATKGRKEEIEGFLRKTLQGKYSDEFIRDFAILIDANIKAKKGFYPDGEFTGGLFKIMGNEMGKIAAPEGIRPGTEIKFGGEGKPGEAKPGRIIPGK